jgi:GNAT superfamily N-acetyltransferase
MIRGFDSLTFFGEPYNKAWYPAFFEGNGFTIRKRWYSIEIKGRTSLQRIANALSKPYELAVADGYSFVPIDTRSPGSIRCLQSAIETSYHKFLGVTPLDREEFNEIFVRYAEALDSRFAIAALNPNGSLSGFAIAYPDYGQALRAMRGADSIVARMRFYLRSRRMNRAVFFMIGITPKEEWRGRGVGRALFRRCLSAMIDAGYESVVFALLAEDSLAWPLVGVVKDDAQKEYALYEATFER